MASATGGHLQTSVGTDEFNVPSPSDAQKFHALPQGAIKRPLSSVGNAHDAGHNVLFPKGGKCAHFFKDGTRLLTAHRNPRTQLCLLPHKGFTTDDLPQRQCPKVPNVPLVSDDINTHVHRHDQQRSLDTWKPIGLGLPPQQTVEAHNVHKCEAKSIPFLIQCLHACTGHPEADTWIKAINKGHHLGWPGLTASRVRKHLMKSEITAMGQPKQHWQGAPSTSKGATDNDVAGEQRVTALDIGRRRNAVVQSALLNGIVGTDQTGRLPVTSKTRTQVHLCAT